MEHGEVKVVIVDDSEAIRKVLRAICEGEGHEVVAEFADGEGLLDFVRGFRPDVVCLDYELPGRNGFELLVEMDHAANQVAVVVITGSDEPELKGHAADLGAAGFIRKPFESAQVINELNEIAKVRAIAARAAAEPEVAQAAVPAAAKAETKAQEKPAAPGAAVVSRTAVVVDDSGSIRLVLKGILEGMGVKVVGMATSGKDAIELVRRFRPALVCLDVDMPGMSGLEALPHIGAASPRTRVVMVTGNASRQVVAEAVTGGAKGYFLKPVRPAKVEEFIRKLLQI
ncbi:MAG: response regulator [Dechloromonas sp.]|nr:response regulator [Dechloromonas sp.]